MGPVLASLGFKGGIVFRPGSLMSTPVFSSMSECCDPPFPLVPEEPPGDEASAGGVGVYQQLKAVGPQDRALTLDPEVTFFAPDWDTHFDFRTEPVEVPFDRELSSAPYPEERYPFFSDRSTTHVAEVPLDKADMLGSVVLELHLPPITQGVIGGRPIQGARTSWVESVAFAMIEYVQFSVDGQILQTISGRMLYLLGEVQPLGSLRRGYERMTGRGVTHSGLEPVEIYLPLPFWFCRTDDLSRPGFPLCALRRGSKVTITMRVRPWGEVVRTLESGVAHTYPDLESSLVRAKLICTMVKLEADQRSMFRHGIQEFLIEQMQEQTEIVERGVHNFKREILLSRATKALFFTVQDMQDVTGDSVLGNRWTELGTFDLITASANRRDIQSGAFPPPVLTAQIFLSNEEREPRAPRLPDTKEDHRAYYKYYTMVQPFYSDAHMPREKIYCYFFALAPFALVPTGNYDLSTSTNLLHIRTTDRISRRLQLTIFSTSYNVLLIDGQGEVAVKYID
jgi:hypothetical protein